MGEEPMGPEHRGNHFHGHPMFTLELLPLADFSYDLGPGPENDLGYGVSLSLGYMTLWGLALEAKAGVRRHSSYEI